MRFLAFLKNTTSPDDASSRGILVTSFVVILLIFGSDLADGSTIWLHLLYIFPISALAFYGKRIGWVAVGVVFAAVLQLLTLLSYKLYADAITANFVVTLATNMTIAGVARAARVRYARIEALAAVDPLTGLFNRRGLESLAEREIARQKRYGGVFSLAVLDLDRFKELNDSKGHEAGDLPAGIRVLSFLRGK